MILALAAALLLPSLGAAPFERAEIYFVAGARSMLERGELLFPYYRGEPFFDKPILTYWLMALSFRLLGFTAEAARLVPALATLLSLLATAWLGRLLLGRAAAASGTLVLATTLAFVAFGRVAMSDMLLTLWTTLAMALGVAALSDPPRESAVPLLGAVLGLGFLTKGPVSVLLPGLGILVLLLWSRGRRPHLTTRGVTAGIGLFALIGLGWYLVLLLRLGPGPLEHFFLRENLERFAGATYDSGRPPWYYLATYLAEGLPWSLFLPAALLTGLRRGPEASGARVLAAWAGLMLVPLSLSRGKIDYYLLPVYPPLALLVGRYLSVVDWRRGDRVAARAAMLLLGLPLVVAAFLPVPLPAAWLPGLDVQLLLRGLALSAGALLLASVVRPSPRRILGLLAASTAMLFLVLVLWFLPAFRKGQPNQAIVADVLREHRYRPDAEMISCDDPLRVERDILFEARLAGRDRCDLWNFASSDYPYLLLVSAEERASLRRVPGLRVVREYPYVPATVLTLEGLLRTPAPERLSLLANYPTRDPVAIRKAKKERKRALRALDELGLPHPDDD